MFIYFVMGKNIVFLRKLFRNENIRCKRIERYEKAAVL